MKENFLAESKDISYRITLGNDLRLDFSGRVGFDLDRRESFWITHWKRQKRQKMADMCIFAASENLRAQFDGIDAEVLPTGIPVRRQFYQAYDRQELRRKFNWSEQDIVCLLMGGGEGLLPMESIVKAFHGYLPQRLKIIAVAGHNEILQHRLEIFKEIPLTVYGFTDDVPELLLAADIVVTKAGGLTAAETLIAGCNYIIYKPLPGQETGNAVYLEQYCGAQVAGSPQEVKTMVCRYADVDSQVRLLQRQQRSLKYGKPGAAEEISNYILKKLEK